MAWREAFLRYLGPGLLSGITSGDWFRLLRENRFAVAPSRFPKALGISLQSLQNSIVSQYESWRYGSRVIGTPVQPPLFILGHWRQGTRTCTTCSRSMIDSPSRTISKSSSPTRS